MKTIVPDKGYNPLKDLLSLVEDSSVEITKDILYKIYVMFLKGGFVLETFEEVMHILQLFCNNYNILRIIVNNDTQKVYLEKI